MRIRKAVIPAAGYGTRLLPATKAVKKELFPLVDRDGCIKPIIQMIVEEAVESGIEEICVVVSPGGDEPLRNYFSTPLPSELDRRIAQSPEEYDRYRHILDLGKRIHYVFQHKQEGYGHAVYCARDWVGDEPFLLLLGDHIYVADTEKRCARQLIEAFETRQVSTSAVAQTHESMLKYFGVVAATPDPEVSGLYAVTEIIEKPSVEYARNHLRIDGLADGQYLAWFGTHAFTAEVFDCIEYHIRNNIRERGEIQLTNTQELLRKRHGQYYAIEIEGRRYDIGIAAEYARTMGVLAGHIPG